MRSTIAGVGSYLPEKCLTNDDLAKIMETSDEWISTRTGIKKRHIAADGEFTSDLAVEAAKRAMDAAGVNPADIDLVIVGTTSPDYIFPSTAAIVQDKLGIPPCAAFDVQAVCSGFVYALTTADLYIRMERSKCALVIGAETMSRLVDWNDRTTCVLFGDGAGAFVLKAAPDDCPNVIGASKLYADGSCRNALITKGGPSQKTFGTMVMDGRTVFKAAVENMPKVSLEVLAQQNLTVADVDWMVPHQANQRILDGVAERLNFPRDSVISTIADHANTSAATIPLAFSVALDQGKIKRGQRIIMPVMGAGFTWGAVELVY